MPQLSSQSKTLQSRQDYTIVACVSPVSFSLKQSTLTKAVEQHSEWFHSLVSQEERAS